MSMFEGTELHLICNFSDVHFDKYIHVHPIIPDGVLALCDLYGSSEPQSVKTLTVLKENIQELIVFIYESNGRWWKWATVTERCECGFMPYTEPEEITEEIEDHIEHRAMALAQRYEYLIPFGTVFN